MAGSTTTDDLTQELQATLNARRDLGVGYDDHFAESFMEKLKTQLIQEVRAEVQRSTPSTRVRRQPLSVERRLSRSIISLTLVVGLFLLFALLLIGRGYYGEGMSTLQLLCLAAAFGILIYNIVINLRVGVK